MKRRIFLRASSGVALAAGPSERIRVGLIGSGGRGRTLTRRFRRHDDVEIGAVCDIYEPNLEAGLSTAGPGTQAYRDYRKLLDNKEIDAVIIATPEHWHHRMLLDAIAAGKDIYIEKPLCRTPEEGVGDGQGSPCFRPGRPGRHAAAQLFPVSPSAGSAAFGQAGKGTDGAHVPG